MTPLKNHTFPAIFYSRYPSGLAPEWDATQSKGFRRLPVSPSPTTMCSGDLHSPGQPAGHQQRSLRFEIHSVLTIMVGKGTFCSFYMELIVLYGIYYRKLVLAYLGVLRNTCYLCSAHFSPFIRLDANDRDLSPS
jgi:hypothetical protein